MRFKPNGNMDASANMVEEGPLDLFLVTWSTGNPQSAKVLRTAKSLRTGEVKKGVHRGISDAEKGRNNSRFFERPRSIKNLFSDSRTGVWGLRTRKTCRKQVRSNMPAPLLNMPRGVRGNAVGSASNWGAGAKNAKGLREVNYHLKLSRELTVARNARGFVTSSRSKLEFGE